MANEAVAEISAPPVTPPRISEDWMAVLIGGALVALVVFGLRPGLPRFAWSSGATLAGSVLSAPNLIASLGLGLLLFITATGGAAVMGVRLGPFARGFPLIYALAWLAQVIAGHASAAAYGLEYVLFALLIGLVLGHTTPLRSWFREAVQAEYFIKIGLVILGATVVFRELVGAGFVGIVQAVVVVISVWFFSFWLCRRLRVDDEFAALLSSAVSICGVSAAIAACGAIQGDRKKLSYVTSLVLVVAVPMMVVMPWIARASGMPEAVAGAWLGGTLDTSAAVVAAGEMISDQARNAAVVVKLSQNVLIGVAAFLLTLWWSMKKNDGRQASGFAVIWERFPKFVLGFLAVSFLFSFALDAQAITATRGALTAIRTAWFGMAFVCIGLETSVGDLVSTDEGRPALAFLGGQTFNIVVTLLMAWLLFGGLLFAPPRFGG
ncbi:MAG: putative sulfate exporter family transporter [Vicinamibacterales bacterium]